MHALHVTNSAPVQVKSNSNSNLKKLNCPNKNAFLHGKFSFAAQWLDYN
jgi:hypothetical protein